MRLPCLRPWLGAVLLLAGGGLLSRPVVAQDPSYVLTGTVVDADTRQPLSDATVQLRTGTDAGPRALTDAAGRFTLRARVGAGTYNLQFTRIGRAAASRQSCRP